MFVLLSGVGVALLGIDIEREFFRMMTWIVSIVSPRVIFGFEINPGFVLNLRSNY
jgi:hypothetical protein